MSEHIPEDIDGFAPYRPGPMVPGSKIRVERSDEHTRFYWNEGTSIGIVGFVFLFVLPLSAFSILVSFGLTGEFFKAGCFTTLVAFVWTLERFVSIVIWPPIEAIVVTDKGLQFNRLRGCLAFYMRAKFVEVAWADVQNLELMIKSEGADKDRALVMHWRKHRRGEGEPFDKKSILTKRLSEHEGQVLLAEIEDWRQRHG